MNLDVSTGNLSYPTTFTLVLILLVMDQIVSVTYQLHVICVIDNKLFACLFKETIGFTVFISDGSVW